MLIVFFFNDTATTEIYTLSLHDALPIYFGFLGLGLSVDGVLGLWCGAFWVFWVWALYINIKE